MSDEHSDVLIAGGGLVGLTLALALSGSGMRIRLVDQVPLAESPAVADERHLALSEVTCRSLQALAAFPASDAEAIRAIHVSSAGEFGAVRWRAAESGLTRFGAVVPARRLWASLRQAALRCSDIELIAPARVSDAQISASAVQARVLASDAASERCVAAPLLVIADGAESALRAAAGINVSRHDYQRHAICCAIWPERDHQGTAYERFTRSGPVALLPQAKGRCGAVWVVDRLDVAQRMALNDAEFLAAFQDVFGYRLGRMQRVGERVAYPLRRVLAERLTAPRQVLIGNAAQAVHPVGAQGFNLGLRDATALAELLIDAHQRRLDPGGDELLTSYAAARAADRTATTGLSHLLAQATTLNLAPAAWLRTLALLAADRLQPVREHLTLAGMGFRGQTSNWARQA